MTLNSHEFRLQRRVCRSLEQSIAALERHKSPEIRRYERSYKRALSRNFQTSSIEDLMLSVRKADLIFLGDYHSFPQSQRTLLRILRQLSEGEKNKSAVALECFPESQQDLLERFQNEEINLEELQKESAFAENWPFPWENYAPVLEFCREQKIPLLAVNMPDGASRSLAERDSFSGDRIASFLAAHPGKRLFVLYGDLHVAPGFLPAQARRSLQERNERRRAVSIFQNDSGIFWSLARHGKLHAVDVVKLGAREFCVQNAAPWVKLQSYLDWIENSAAEAEEEADYAGRIRELMRYFAQALELPAPEPTDFTVYGWDNLEYLKRELRAQPGARQAIRRLGYGVLFGRPAYFASIHALFLPRATPNALADAAFAVFRGQAFPDEDPAPLEPAHLANVILSHARNYLCTKLVNPKRKCDEIRDMENFLGRYRAKSGPLARKIRIHRFALRLAKAMLRSRGRLPARWQLSYLESCEATRAAGFLLGERLHLAHRENLWKLRDLKDFVELPWLDAPAALSMLKHLAKIARTAGDLSESKDAKL